jgi:hypothetical protein
VAASVSASPMWLDAVVTSVHQAPTGLDQRAAHPAIVMKLDHVTTSAMNRQANVPVSRTWQGVLVISVVLDIGDSPSVGHVSVMKMLIPVIR